MSRVGRDARILLVDDSANDVEFALDAFSEGRLGNRIDVARSGQEALDQLFGRKPDPDSAPLPLPDLILHRGRRVHDQRGSTAARRPPGEARGR
jgi:two-component system response regulator